MPEAETKEQRLARGVAASARGVSAARPRFSDGDIGEIVVATERILKSGRMILGEYTRKFEDIFSRYVGTRHGVAVSTGTAALQIVLRFYRTKGREIVLPVNNFPGVVTAVIDEGGIPVLAGMNPATFGLDVDDAMKRVTERTAGIVVVHIAGLVCPEIDRLRQFCEAKGLFLIEDASHAHGASIDGRKAGSLADAACFSFYPTKILTTGTGGMITTNSDELAAFARSVRHHGQGQQRELFVRMGNDWCLSEIHAAIGLQQLRSLDENVAWRNALVARYRDALRHESWIEIPAHADNLVHAYYKFPVLLREGLDAKPIRESLQREFQIENGTIYAPPCHKQPVFQDLFKEVAFPEAERILANQLCPPVHSSLSEGDVDRVVAALKTLAHRYRAKEIKGPAEPAVLLETPKSSRLLFVIDNDYGELTLARLFVHGRSLESRSTFLLPPRLYVGNQESDGPRTLAYSSYRDILAVIAAENPTVVFLCSGYLLADHQLVSVPILEGLVPWLEERGCTVVTSDPFWGILADPDSATFPETKGLTEAAKALRSAVHLYPAPFHIEGLHCTSFFNASFVDAAIPPLPAEFWEGVGGADSFAERPYWLFPLTQLDYNVQITLHGREEFAWRVVTLLANALQSGRGAVLLAPDDCIWRVERQLGGAKAAVLLPYCKYDQFVRLLINAEYAFYWNAGSASAHLRMVRGLPVFSFDPGHIARSVPAWLDRMRQHYYGGRMLPCLNQDQGLRPETLEAMASDWRRAGQSIHDNLITSPTPEMIVNFVSKDLG